MLLRTSCCLLLLMVSGPLIAQAELLGTGSTTAFSSEPGLEFESGFGWSGGDPESLYFDRDSDDFAGTIIESVTLRIDQLDFISPGLSCETDMQVDIQVLVEGRVETAIAVIGFLAWDSVAGSQRRPSPQAVHEEQLPPIRRRWARILSITEKSWITATNFISTLHCGQSSGSTSKIRFKSRAQLRRRARSAGLSPTAGVTSIAVSPRAPRARLA